MTGSLYSISAEFSFVDALAEGLLARAGGDPAALADMLVLLPTRRACRSLREAFLRQSDGRPLLLPRMRPVGDVDEEELVLSAPGSDTAFLDLIDLPPTISSTERLLHLTRLVRAQRNAMAEADPALDPIGPDQALLLARELAHLLDQVQTEGLSLDRLDGLVPEDYADHWAKTLEFLEILRAAWPAYLAETGEIDPAERRNRLIEAQAAHWRAAPPDTPVIVAGSTGSIPATATLIAAVAGLPKGMVVLPGLDRYLDDEAWDALTREPGDPTHPQFGLALLLTKLGAGRADVAEWKPVSDVKRQARIRLFSESLRPAKTTGQWHGLGADSAIDASALDGLQWLNAPSAAAEAELAALYLREALEVPGRTAALVTPDRTLARRVAALMDRWGIEIDDSAGLPLAQTQAGRFFLLTAEAAAARLSPVALLAVLKHPLSGLGDAPAAVRRAVRRLETACLRGPKPSPGAAGLRAVVAARREGRGSPGQAVLDQVLETVDRIDRILTPLEAALSDGDVSFETVLTAHLTALEALAATETEPGADRLWCGEDGEALADFIGELQPVAALIGDIRPNDYAPVLTTLIMGKTVRPRFGTHPRLAILGPLEARLQHADRLILAGLNEGTWPPEPPEDPWLSRDMRRKFGLPAHERRIGLAAHDFTQACGAPDVILLRAEKLGGQPMVAARWLERLGSVLKRLGLSHALPEENRDSARLLSWQDRLNGVPERLPILPRPAPRPPVAARPRGLSATRVETLMRDPYQIFAERILRLRALEDLEADLGAAEKGTMIHAALDDFVKTYPGDLPEDAADILIALGEQAFGAESLARPAVRAFWWPRFERIARWFAAREADRRGGLAESHTEIRGEYTFDSPGGPFTLSAEADRIDLYRDGGYAILDYKTGAVPTKKDVESLSAPQLVLEAAILKQGGFPDVTPGHVSELAYWKLSGGDPAGAVTVIDKVDADALAETVLEKLKALIAAYDDPATAYTPVPRRNEAPKYNDYEHLARIKEWSLGDSDGGGEGGGA